MGRTARRPGPPSFMFGVWGQGETSKENIAALLSEFIEGLGEITPRFLIPLDKDITTDTHLDVADWALEQGYAVEVVEAAPVRTKVLREIKAEAQKVHEADDADNPIEKVFAEAVIAKGESARLLFLWAEDDGEPDEDDQRVLADIFDGGVACLDLTQGLDVLGFDGDDTGAADEGGDAEPAADDAGSDEPDEDTVRGWAVRRIRTHALEVAKARRKAKEKDVPTDDELADFKKDDLLGFLYGTAEEPAADDAGGEEKPITPRRARQMREEVEADGKKAGSGTARQKRAAAAAQDDAEPPAAPAEGADAGGDADGPLSAAHERMLEGLSDFSNPDLEEDEQNEAFVVFADALADVIIDRIAARVEKEPEESAVRQEIAPKRPPGKPRKDGATPTRRRTRS